MRCHFFPLLTIALLSIKLNGSYSGKNWKAVQLHFNVDMLPTELPELLRPHCRSASQRSELFSIQVNGAFSSVPEPHLAHWLSSSGFPMTVRALIVPVRQVQLGMAGYLISKLANTKTTSKSLVLLNVIYAMDHCPHSGIKNFKFYLNSRFINFLLIVVIGFGMQNGMQFGKQSGNRRLYRASWGSDSQRSEYLASWPKCSGHGANHFTAVSTGVLGVGPTRLASGRLYALGCQSLSIRL